MIELTQELWLITPKGQGIAILVCDRGSNSDLEWTVIIQSTGEIWTFKNYDVKAAANVTMGIRHEPQRRHTRAGGKSNNGQAPEEVEVVFEGLPRRNGRGVRVTQTKRGLHSNRVDKQA